MRMSFLRVRGGVSSYMPYTLDKIMFSPRTRRCFRYHIIQGRPAMVFSAYAEVFPGQGSGHPEARRFLRVRGGVSMSRLTRTHPLQFSPRTRRCFQGMAGISQGAEVFSAYAEVFPKCSEQKQAHRGFLRVRGGVSIQLPAFFSVWRFSPRTRRCFHSFLG